MTGNEKLYLKWGSLKGWKVDEDGPAFKAIRRYFEHPVFASAMAQVDTPEQKQAICDAIDALDGEIRNDWTGRVMTKDEAKAYVMEYRP